MTKPRVRIPADGGKPRVRLGPGQTMDGLINIASGLGLGKGKRDHNRFVHGQLLGYAELEAAYQTNWIARQIVDIPADDATREWRTVKGKHTEEFLAEEWRLNLQACVNEALSWSRLYGGAAILPITNQDFEKPFRPELIKKGEVQRLMVFDRWDLIPHAINTWDVLADNYLQPEFYTLYQGSQKIHWTHFVRFTGGKLPRRQRVLLQGWGDSQLRRCLEDIKDTVSAKDGIAELMQAANVDVITREGLSEDLATDQESAIIERYQLFDQMKSIINTALLDSTEKLDRLTLNMSGIAPVLETLMVWISGAADIPVTRLFGTSAKGLNATGEGDLKNYYDSIRGIQNSQIDRPLALLDEIIARSALGSFPEDHSYEWVRLMQPNRKEEAEARKIEAETDIIYLDAGVIGRSHVMRNLESEEMYQYEDGVIDRIEESEDLSLGPVQPEGNDDLTGSDGTAFSFADSWNEADHPRDDIGRFSSGGTGASAGNQDFRQRLEGPMTQAQQRELVQSEAEAFGKRLQSHGFEVKIEHSGSRAGPSSYVSVSDPETGVFSKSPARFSGHSKGVFGSTIVHEVMGSKDMDDFEHMMLQARNEARKKQSSPEVLAEKAKAESAAQAGEDKQKEKFRKVFESIEHKKTTGEKLNSNERYAVENEAELRKKHGL